MVKLDIAHDLAHPGLIKIIQPKPETIDLWLQALCSFGVAITANQYSGEQQNREKKRRQGFHMSIFQF